MMMIVRIFLAALGAIMFLALPSHADLMASSNQKNSNLPIKKLKIVIPQKLDESAQGAIIEKLTGMEKQRFVYLDLSVPYDVSARPALPYSVTLHGKPTNPKDDSNALLMGEGITYWLGPVANYNHLVLSVYTGERSAFPYNDVAREYSGQPDRSIFRIRGFFYVLSHSIPTAISLQLRPFNPPFDIAVTILAP